MSNDCSKLMDSRVDLKAFTYECFNVAIDVLKSGELENVSLSPNTKVLFLTQFGIVEGTPSKKDSPNNNVKEAFTNMLIFKTFEGRNQKIEDMKTKNPDLTIINDTGSIVLENVVITSYANPDSKFNLGTFVLFTDSIIGISFGETSSESS
jgi:hypothetical protein